MSLLFEFEQIRTKLRRLALVYQMHCLFSMYCVLLCVLGILEVLFFSSGLYIWTCVQRWTLCRIVQLSTTKWYPVWHISWHFSHICHAQCEYSFIYLPVHFS